LRDLEGNKQFSLDLTAGLKAHSGTAAQVGGERVENEVHAFFAAMDYLREGDNWNRLTSGGPPALRPRLPVARRLRTQGVTMDA
jgi:hypothetical protein